MAGEVYRVFEKDTSGNSEADSGPKNRHPGGLASRRSSLSAGWASLRNCESSLKPTREKIIPILQLENAWTEAIEGPVMKGLAEVNSLERAAAMKVVDRKARKHYGFELSVA